MTKKDEKKLKLFEEIHMDNYNDLKINNNNEQHSKSIFVGNTGSGKSMTISPYLKSQVDNIGGEENIAKLPTFINLDQKSLEEISATSEKDINYYLNLPYTTNVKRVDSPTESYYWAWIEELEGCHTDGITAVEAITELEELKRDFLEVMLENGTMIPEPDEDLPSGKFALRMPRTLHRDLLKESNREGISLNQLIVYKISRKM